MSMTDFEYDGKRLSDIGFVVANITTDGSTETVSIGSTLTWNTVKNNCSSINKITSTQYDEAYSTTFEICKDPCSYDNHYINEEELRYIMRWLNRKEYHKFVPLQSDYVYSEIHYYGSFNLEAIKLSGEIIGLSLTFYTNAPFGFYETFEFEYEITQAMIDTGMNTFTLIDNSDEIGRIYLNVEVTTQGFTGTRDLVIRNSLTGLSTEIKRCSGNETITMDGNNKIIQTSNAAHTRLCNDFNYAWLSIMNTFDTKENVYTVTAPCHIKLSYNPIRKIGVI